MAKVKRKEKGQENSMQTSFTERITTFAPTVRSFKQALHPSHSSSNYQDSVFHKMWRRGQLQLHYPGRLQWRRKLWIYLCCLGSVQCRRFPCVGWFLERWSHSCTRHPSEIHQHGGDAQELSTGLKIQMTMGDKVRGERREITEKGWSFSEHPLPIVLFPFTLSISNRAHWYCLFPNLAFLSW